MSAELSPPIPIVASGAVSPPAPPLNHPLPPPSHLNNPNSTHNPKSPKKHKDSKDSNDSKNSNPAKPGKGVPLMQPLPVPDSEALKVLRADLVQRIFNYYHAIETLKLSDLWKRSWQQYYSGFYNLGVARKMKKVGDQTELLKLSINDYGNIIRNLHTLITREPPLIDAKPINPSTQAIAEVIPAKILLEFYQDQKYLDKEIAQAKLYELLFGTGYIVIDWNPHAGQLVSSNATQGSIHQGDLSFSTHTPFDVIHNIYGSPNDIDWYIVRSLQSKHQMARRYNEPKLRSETMLADSYIDITLRAYSNNIPEHDKDKIDVFTYYEKASMEHPRGRKIVFTRQHILSLATLPTKEIPVIRIANETIMNTTLGSSIAFDLLEIQKSKDSLISTIINNQASFGLNSVVVPKSAQIEASKLGTRLNILEVSDMTHRPQVLDLLRSNPEIFQMVAYLEKAMERISGINAVVRGSAHASQSGQALALITSMSLQFASGYLRTFRETYKQAGERILGLLKHNLPAARQYRIIGRSGKVFQGRLSSEGLYDDYHISVELVSPLKSTVQGREIIANTLLEKGFISEPREYLSVLVHGRIDDILTPEAKLKESLKYETERLISHEPIQILEVQNHPAFIKHDLSILNDHEKLKEPQLITRVYEVVLKRLEAWKRISAENPELLRIAGIPIYTPMYTAEGEAAAKTMSAPANEAATSPSQQEEPLNPTPQTIKSLLTLIEALRETKGDEEPPAPPLAAPNKAERRSRRAAKRSGHSHSRAAHKKGGAENQEPTPTQSLTRRTRKIAQRQAKTRTQNDVPLPNDPLTEEPPNI